MGFTILLSILLIGSNVVPFEGWGIQLRLALFPCMYWNSSRFLEWFCYILHSTRRNIQLLQTFSLGIIAFTYFSTFFSHLLSMLGSSLLIKALAFQWHNHLLNFFFFKHVTGLKSKNGCILTNEMNWWEKAWNILGPYSLQGHKSQSQSKNQCVSFHLHLIYCLIFKKIYNFESLFAVV